MASLPNSSSSSSSFCSYNDPSKAQTSRQSYHDLNYGNDELDSNAGTFYLSNPPFSTYPACKVYKNGCPQIPQPSIRKLEFGAIDIDQFNICRKKKPAENERHLLFCYFTKKFPVVTSGSDEEWSSGKTFGRYVPIMIPNDYISSEHRTRKQEILQKYIYITTLDDNTFSKYVYLVERTRLNSSMDAIIHVICGNEKIFRINDIKLRLESLKLLMNKSKKLEVSCNYDDISKITSQMYNHLLCYWLAYYFCGGEKMLVFGNEFVSPVTFQLFGQEIFWLLHLTNPTFENFYKTLCTSFGLEYTPSYVFHSGEGFAEHIFNIIEYGLSALKPKINFLLKSKGLDSELFWKIRRDEVKPENHIEETTKIVYVLSNDTFFVTSMDFEKCLKEVKSIGNSGLEKLKEELFKDQPKTPDNIKRIFNENYDRISKVMNDE
jgi:hypothetical protein